MTRDRQAVVGVVTYVALMAAWIYAGENASLRYGHEDVYGAISLVALVVVHLGLGLLVGRWWGLLVYAVPVLLAIPAGRPPYLYHDQGAVIWRVLLLVSPVALGLIALGVGLRRLSLEPRRT